ncbi:NAD-dependent epimerase/dehydratase family protein [Sporosarcina sp. FSL K6-3457]|uniref:NAD-dependent epimerase/dehydratase family protein n=1 Tax=Sporosarcina sp. FSL K6-3457 TaxID=2978204 RepID=UPI0030FA5056
MRIMITGENGYIGNKIERYLHGSHQDIDIQRISARNFTENSYSFEGVESIIHTAALVHQKESNYTEQDYFDVNCSLTIELAQKAKGAGVRHFVFFSTMAVYSNTTKIMESTPVNPTSLYGKSKLAAEKQLMELADEQFIVSIIRPPMVYGPGCPGNYALLSKLVKKTPVFPLVANERSMIFIDNLTEFVRQLIKNQDEGIFHPQDREYIRTSDMVNEIASVHGRRIIMSKLSGRLLVKLFGRMSIVSKVFGDLTYAKELSKYRDNSYQLVGLKEAIKMSEVTIED